MSLAKKADVFIVAPATANVIAKMAAGIADDMLTTTLLAARCPKLVAPAMNTGMYDNPITQRNLETLRRFGVTVLEPDSGLLACGDTGRGRLPRRRCCSRRYAARWRRRIWLGCACWSRQADT